jgi:ubiquinone/menaquinone biosynthesis C-methylase UbiE
MNLLWYDTEHSSRLQAQVTLAVTDEQLLQDYYADNQQHYVLTTPFLQAFHERRLAVLRRLFRQYITAGSNVIDVGSGHSMFYLIAGERWPHQIICIDLDRALMKQIGPERSGYNWMVGAVQRLPFADATFDALYAGEVIEHVQDANATLAEWGRVLRPGGTIIVTTPNRERLLNRVNRTNTPVSFEHLVEFTCDELDDLFNRHGFEVLKREGIYLELLALWRQRPPYVDPLTASQPLRRHLAALKPLMSVGRVLPWLAWDLIVVGRKR